SRSSHAAEGRWCGWSPASARARLSRPWASRSTTFKPTPERTNSYLPYASPSALGRSEGFPLAKKVQVVRGLMDAFNRRDLEEFLTFMHPAVEFFAPQTASAVGRVTA